MERLTLYETIDELSERLNRKHKDTSYRTVLEGYSLGRCNELLDVILSISRKLIEELEAYKDAEEQGLLLRLPCKVGDVVYAITSPFNLGIDMEDELDVFECVVESIAFYRNGLHQIRLYHKGKFVGWLVRFTDLGKTVFLTREEAEKALEDMKGKV